MVEGNGAAACIKDKLRRRRRSIGKDLVGFREESQILTPMSASLLSKQNAVSHSGV